MGSCRSAGIWDDRYSATTADFGGHCDLVTPIEEFVDEPLVEVLSITLANDGSIDGLAHESDDYPDSQSISCVRLAKGYRHMLIPAFGKSCVEPIDEELYREYRVRIMAGPTVNVF